MKFNLKSVCNFLIFQSNHLGSNPSPPHDRVVPYKWTTGGLAAIYVYIYLEAIFYKISAFFNKIFISLIILIFYEIFLINFEKYKKN